MVDININEALKTVVTSTLAMTTFLAMIGGVFVFCASFNRMKEEKRAFLDVGGYVAFLFPILIAVVSLAATGGEFAYKVITDGAPGLAWLFGSILGTLVGLPQIGKFAKGDTNVSIEKVERITTSDIKPDSNGTVG